MGAEGGSVGAGHDPKSLSGSAVHIACPSPLDGSVGGPAVGTGNHRGGRVLRPGT